MSDRRAQTSVDPRLVTDMARRITAVLHARPTLVVFIDGIVSQLWRRYVGIYDRGDDTAPEPDVFLDLLRGDLCGDSATMGLFQTWQTASDYDRCAIDDVLALITTNRHGQSEYTAFTRGLDRLTSRYLTHPESAQLAAWFAKRAALGTGRKEQNTTEAASARLQLLADQWLFLSADEQRLIAAVVGGFANGTPDRAVAVRRALRDLVVGTCSTVHALGYIVKACLDRIVKAAAVEEHP